MISDDPFPRVPCDSVGRLIKHVRRAGRITLRQNTVCVPVSRLECVSGLSVYWPIIALGTRECGVAKLCRDPTVQSEFFLRVSLLKTFN